MKVFLKSKKYFVLPLFSLFLVIVSLYSVTISFQLVSNNLFEVENEESNVENNNNLLNEEKPNFSNQEIIENSSIEKEEPSVNFFDLKYLNQIYPQTLNNLVKINQDQLFYLFSYIDKKLAGESQDNLKLLYQRVDYAIGGFDNVQDYFQSINNEIIAQIIENIQFFWQTAGINSFIYNDLNQEQTKAEQINNYQSYENLFSLEFHNELGKDTYLYINYPDLSKRTEIFEITLIEKIDYSDKEPAIITFTPESKFWYYDELNNRIKIYLDSMLNNESSYYVKIKYYDNLKQDVEEYTNTTWVINYADQKSLWDHSINTYDLAFPTCDSNGSPPEPDAFFIDKASLLLETFELSDIYNDSSIAIQEVGIIQYDNIFMTIEADYLDTNDNGIYNENSDLESIVNTASDLIFGRILTEDTFSSYRKIQYSNVKPATTVDPTYTYKIGTKPNSYATDIAGSSVSVADETYGSRFHDQVDVTWLCKQSNGSVRSNDKTYTRFNDEVSEALYWVPYREWTTKESEFNVDLVSEFVFTDEQGNSKYQFSLDIVYDNYFTYKTGGGSTEQDYTEILELKLLDQNSSNSYTFETNSSYNYGILSQDSSTKKNYNLAGVINADTTYEIRVTVNNNFHRTNPKTSTFTIGYIDATNVYTDFQSLTVIDLTYSTVTIKLENLVIGKYNYEFEYSLDGGQTWFIIGSDPNSELLSQDTFKINNLSPLTSYNLLVRVAWVNLGPNQHSISKSAYFLTDQIQDFVTEPFLEQRSNTSQEATLIFVYSLTFYNGDPYTIQYSLDNGQNWSEVNSIDFANNSFTISGLEIGKEYNMIFRLNDENLTISNSTNVTTSSYLSGSSSEIGTNIIINLDEMIGEVSNGIAYISGIKISIDPKYKDAAFVNFGLYTTNGNDINISGYQISPDPTNSSALFVSYYGPLFGIEIQGMNISWNSSQEDPNLSNIEVAVPFASINSIYDILYIPTESDLAATTNDDVILQIEGISNKKIQFDIDFINSSYSYITDIKVTGPGLNFTFENSINFLEPNYQDFDFILENLYTGTNYNYEISYAIGYDQGDTNTIKGSTSTTNYLFNTSEDQEKLSLVAINSDVALVSDDTSELGLNNLLFSIPSENSDSYISSVYVYLNQEFINANSLGAPYVVYDDLTILNGMRNQNIYNLNLNNSNSSSSTTKDFSYGDYIAAIEINYIAEDFINGNLINDSYIVQPSGQQSDSILNWNPNRILGIPNSPDQWENIYNLSINQISTRSALIEVEHLINNNNMIDDFPANQSDYSNYYEEIGELKEIILIDSSGNRIVYDETDSNWITNQNSNSVVTLLNLTNLKPGEVYQVEIGYTSSFGYNGTSQSAQEPTLNYVNKGEFQAEWIYDDLGSVSIQNITSNGAQVKIDSLTSKQDAIAYDIQYSIKNNNTNEDSGFIYKLTDEEILNLLFDVYSLGPNTNYTINVRLAYADGTYSSNIEEVSFITLDQASVTNVTKITYVNDVDNNTKARFIIEVDSKGNPYDIEYQYTKNSNTSWTSWTQIPNGTNEVEIDSLEKGTDYSIRFRLVGISGSSYQIAFSTTNYLDQNNPISSNNNQGPITVNFEEATLKMSDTGALISLDNIYVLFEDYFDSSLLGAGLTQSNGSDSLGLVQLDPLNSNKYYISFNSVFSFEEEYQQIYFYWDQNPTSKDIYNIANIDLSTSANITIANSKNQSDENILLIPSEIDSQLVEDNFEYSFSNIDSTSLTLEIQLKEGINNNITKVEFVNTLTSNIDYVQEFQYDEFNYLDPEVKNNQKLVIDATNLNSNTNYIVNVSYLNSYAQTTSTLNLNIGVKTLSKLPTDPNAAKNYIQYDLSQISYQLYDNNQGPNGETNTIDNFKVNLSSLYNDTNLTKFELVSENQQTKITADIDSISSDNTIYTLSFANVPFDTNFNELWIYYDNNTTADQAIKLNLNKIINIGLASWNIDNFSYNVTTDSFSPNSALIEITYPSEIYAFENILQEIIIYDEFSSEVFRIDKNNPNWIDNNQNKITIEVNNLQPTKTYEIKIIFIDSYALSLSNETTLGSFITADSYSAYDQILFTNKTADSLTVQLSNLVRGTEEFTIQYQIFGGNFDSDQIFEIDPNNASDFNQNNEFIINNLDPYTKYTIQVTLLFADGYKTVKVSNPELTLNSITNFSDITLSSEKYQIKVTLDNYQRGTAESEIKYFVTDQSNYTPSDSEYILVNVDQSGSFYIDSYYDGSSLKAITPEKTYYVYVSSTYASNPNPGTADPNLYFNKTIDTLPYDDIIFSNSSIILTNSDSVIVNLEFNNIDFQNYLIEYQVTEAGNNPTNNWQPALDQSGNEIGEVNFSTINVLVPNLNPSIDYIIQFRILKPSSMQQTDLIELNVRTNYSYTIIDDFYLFDISAPTEFQIKVEFNSPSIVTTNYELQYSIREDLNSSPVWVAVDNFDSSNDTFIIDSINGEGLLNSQDYYVQLRLVYYDKVTDNLLEYTFESQVKIFETATLPEIISLELDQVNINSAIINYEIKNDEFADIELEYRLTSGGVPGAWNQLQTIQGQQGEIYYNGTLTLDSLISATTYVLELRILNEETTTFVLQFETLYYLPSTNKVTQWEGSTAGDQNVSVSETSITNFRVNEYDNGGKPRDFDAEIVTVYIFDEAGNRYESVFDRKEVGSGYYYLESWYFNFYNLPSNTKFVEVQYVYTIDSFGNTATTEKSLLDFNNRPSNQPGKPITLAQEAQNPVQDFSIISNERNSDQLKIVVEFNPESLKDSTLFEVKLIDPINGTITASKIETSNYFYTIYFDLDDNINISQTSTLDFSFKTFSNFDNDYIKDPDDPSQDKIITQKLYYIEVNNNFNIQAENISQDLIQVSFSSNSLLTVINNLIYIDPETGQEIYLDANTTEILISLNGQLVSVRVSYQFNASTNQVLLTFFDLPNNFTLDLSNFVIVYKSYQDDNFFSNFNSNNTQKILINNAIEGDFIETGLNEWQIAVIIVGSVLVVGLGWYIFFLISKKDNPLSKKNMKKFNNKIKDMIDSSVKNEDSDK